MKIAIADYGMGNVGSITNTLNLLGIDSFVSQDSKQLSKGDGYILPGVGAFPVAMENLRSRKLVESLTMEVIEKKKPLLGICLGMQLLAEDSEEQGFTMGLGWIKGHVTRIKPDHVRVPHVGWNDVNFRDGNELFSNIEQGAHFYFDHEYHFECENENRVIATCEYGSLLVSAVVKGNIFGVQFHPEKSQRNGLKLLRAFSEFVNGTC